MTRVQDVTWGSFLAGGPWQLPVAVSWEEGVAQRRLDAVALPPQELSKRFQGSSVHVLLKKSRKAREAARTEQGEHEQQNKGAEA